jgi:hypothetical protein
LESGADPNLQTIYGRFPLHAAVEGGNLDIVKLLMHHGADVFATNRGWNALMGAAWQGHSDILDLLVPNYPDWRAMITPGGSLPAILAQRGHTASLKILHEKHDLGLQVPDGQGRYLLHIAAQNGQAEIISFLMDKGISASTKDAKGNDILCHAASSGSLETVNKVLQLMPKTWATDEGVWSPLHWACRAGNKEVVERLVQSGFRSSSVTIGEPMGDWSPIDVAFLHGHGKMLQDLSDGCKKAFGTLTTATRKTGAIFAGWQCDGCDLVSGVLVSLTACLRYTGTLWHEISMSRMSGFRLLLHV